MTVVAVVNVASVILPVLVELESSGEKVVLDGCTCEPAVEEMRADVLKYPDSAVRELRAEEPRVE